MSRPAEWSTTRKRKPISANEARAFRKEMDIPLILVGGMRSFEMAEKLLDEGTADFISMCRPFIREPDLVNRWKSGDRRKALLQVG